MPWLRGVLSCVLAWGSGIAFGDGSYAASAALAIAALAACVLGLLMDDYDLRT